MTQPLVSVMIPCYNASKTLPLALASLLAQTYQNWECIIVDDGSDDNPIDVVNIINDERIRFYRFEENRGRAVARQKALDMAQGEYLCMIDADDWIYPWKLERQVEIMEANPDLALVSAGMAIVDCTGSIAGVQFGGKFAAEFRRMSALSKPQPPPVAHAPSMIRMSRAKITSYTPELARSEDKEYLIRIVMQQPFGSLSCLLYAYAEAEAMTLDKIVAGMRFNRMLFMKYFKQYPRSVLFIYAKTLIKEFVYRIGFMVGFGKYLVKRRSQKPTQNQVREFLEAENMVKTIGKDLFKDTFYENLFDTSR